MKCGVSKIASGNQKIHIFLQSSDTPHFMIFAPL